MALDAARPTMNHSAYTKIPVACFCALLCLIPALIVAGGCTPRKANFGVNGHPLNSGSYAGSLEQQIAHLKMLGLTTYRINVNPAAADKYERLEFCARIVSAVNIGCGLAIAVVRYTKSPSRIARLSGKHSTQGELQ
jgi:hypothetical protein